MNVSLKIDLVISNVELKVLSKVAYISLRAPKLAWHTTITFYR